MPTTPQTRSKPERTLQDQGFLFMRRASGVYQWVHPLEKRDDDTDCTGMSDDEFERFVGENGAAS